MTKRLIMMVAVLALGGCSLDKQAAPALTGPSELGLALAISASPDTISQDGHSQSVLQVIATDANNQPVRGLALQAQVLVGGERFDLGTLSNKSPVTDTNGRASVTFTSPAPPPSSATADSTISVLFTPVGTNAANDISRRVDLHLVRPGTVVGLGSDLVADFKIVPAAPRVGDTTVFDATESADGKTGSHVGPGRTIVNYFWTFNDSTTSTSSKATTHVFALAGTFAVTLTVTDDIGRQSSTTQIITIVN